MSFYLTILDSGETGFAYHNGAPAQGEEIRNLVNQNALGALASETAIDFPLRTSILDASYGEYNKLFNLQPTYATQRDGSYQDKANFRSKLVTEMLPSGRKVLLVGLATEFVRDMLDKEIDVSVSDMSPELKDTTVYNIPVVSDGNQWTLKQLAESDAAVVSGAAFSTNTIDSILQTAEAHGTDLHFYLETGSNFAPHLIDRGVKTVVAEKFPFYDLPGTTTFEVYE